MKKKLGWPHDRKSEFDNLHRQQIFEKDLSENDIRRLSALINMQLFEWDASLSERFQTPLQQEVFLKSEAGQEAVEQMKTTKVSALKKRYIVTIRRKIAQYLILLSRF